MLKTIITGISGQDGAYLAELLLARGDRVVGTCRAPAATDLWRLRELGLEGNPHLEIVALDVTDATAAVRLIEAVGPARIYNLAAESSVAESIAQPRAAAASASMGALNLLEGIRQVDPTIRFYQASTSEMFGGAEAGALDEEAAFRPRSPYAVAKLFAHWMTVNYREAYGLFASSGILFNHESPLRGRNFVTRKITDGVARIRLGLIDRLMLGNLDACRDWGYARDYVEGMRRIMEANAADTFVLATARTHTVRRFVQLAFAAAGIDVDFRGSGVEEVAVDRSTGRVVVAIEPGLFRPTEVTRVVGNPAKARRVLGWSAECSVEQLCAMMVAEDLRRLSGTVAN